MPQRLTVLLLAVSVITSLAAGCERKADEKTEPVTEAAPRIVATVNEQSITESEYDAYRALRMQQRGPILDKNEERRLVLDEMITKALVTQYAQNAKLEQDPVVAAMLREARDNVLAQAVRQQVIRARSITEADIAAAQAVPTPLPHAKASANRPSPSDLHTRADAYRRVQAERMDGFTRELKEKAKIVVY
jgi:hypothetical protein